jgi:hypothetical protein
MAHRLAVVAAALNIAVDVLAHHGSRIVLFTPAVATDRI